MGEMQAFCRERFVTLVLGWTVGAGDQSRQVNRAVPLKNAMFCMCGRPVRFALTRIFDEDNNNVDTRMVPEHRQPSKHAHREAQRATLQLLSALSRQFESNEIHIAFDEGVRLAWEDKHSDEGSSASISGQYGGGDTSSTLARGRAAPSEGGARVGADGSDERDGEHARRDIVGVGVGASLGGVSGVVVPESGGLRTTATGGSEEGWISLTLFLSNLVVACSQVQVATRSLLFFAVCGILA